MACRFRSGTARLRKLKGAAGRGHGTATRRLFTSPEVVYDIGPAAAPILFGLGIAAAFAVYVREPHNA
jgi:hypothetical protein